MKITLEIEDEDSLLRQIAQGTILKDVVIRNEVHRRRDLMEYVGKLLVRTRDSRSATVETWKNIASHIIEEMNKEERRVS
jgi:hypothetical protein